MNAFKVRISIFLVALALLLANSSCTSCTKKGNNAAASSTMPAQTGSYATPVLPNRNHPKTQLLLRTFWVAEHWVNHADNSQNKPNKGHWWRFHDDGTFVVGQWQRELSYGSWVVYNDGDKDLIHMDAADDNFDMEFHMQQVSELKDYMAWAGTGTYGQKRIAVKAISLLSKPTKAQFGITE
ncbi:MAG: hypothetical protein AAGJ82_08400 [Bacteroidota bacterium]